MKCQLGILNLNEICLRCGVHVQVIVEKNPWDDYDGGSRGRIKTKRKGGVGWV